MSCNDFDEEAYLRRLYNVREAMKRYRARLRMNPERWAEEEMKKYEWNRQNVEKIRQDSSKLCVFLKKNREAMTALRARVKIANYIIKEALLTDEFE